MSTWYVNNSTSLGGEVCAKWQSEHTYTAGARCVRSYSNGNAGLAKVFECTTGGTTGTNEPSWDTTDGNTTSDGTAVWTCRAPSDENWDNATPYLGYLYSAGVIAADDLVLIHYEHNSTEEYGAYEGGAITTPVKFACVVKDNNGPYSGGTIGGCDKVFTGFGYSEGVLWKSDSGDITIESTSEGATGWLFDTGYLLALQCGDDLIVNSHADYPVLVELYASGIQLDSSSSAIRIEADVACTFRWQGGALYLDSGSLSSGLFLLSGQGHRILVQGVDLSQQTHAMIAVSGTSLYQADFINCLTHADFATNQGTIGASVTPHHDSRLRFHGCGSSYDKSQLLELTYQGTIQHDYDIYLASSANDGTHPFSWKLSSSANVAAEMSILTSPILRRHFSIPAETGPLIAVVYCLIDSETIPTGQQIWLNGGMPDTSLFSFFTRQKQPLTAEAMPWLDASTFEGYFGVAPPAWQGTGSMTNPTLFCVFLYWDPQPNEEGIIEAELCLAEPSLDIYINPQLVFIALPGDEEGAGGEVG